MATLLIQVWLMVDGALNHYITFLLGFFLLSDIHENGSHAVALPSYAGGTVVLGHLIFF